MGRTLIYFVPLFLGLYGGFLSVVSAADLDRLTVLQKILTNYQVEARTSPDRESFYQEMIWFETSALPGGAPFRIETVQRDLRTVMSIKFTAVATTDLLVFVEFLHSIAFQLPNFKSIASKFWNDFIGAANGSRGGRHLIEDHANTLLKSPLSRYRTFKSQINILEEMKKSRENALQTRKHLTKPSCVGANCPIKMDLWDEISTQDFEAYYQVRMGLLHQQLKPLEEQASAFIASGSRAIQSRKNSIAPWDALSPKLNELVAKNDRKAVRALIDAHLPWELMEPVEKNAWLHWLDAIENPSSQKMILFRGFNNETFVKNVDGALFSFSPFLHNQSLEVLLDRELTLEGPSIGIYSLFGRHSSNSSISYFTSFTTSLDQAARFSGMRTGTMRYGCFAVDPRRAMANFNSGFGTREREYLTALIAFFPDEVVGVFEEPVDIVMAEASRSMVGLKLPEGYYRRFAKNVQKAIRKKMGREISIETIRYGESEKIFKDRGMAALNGLMAHPDCNGLFLSANP